MTGSLSSLWLSGQKREELVAAEEQRVDRALERVRIEGYVVGNDDVGLPGPERGHAFGRSHRRHDDVEMRMVDRELAHRGRDEGGRRGGLGGDPQVAGDDVLQLGNIGFGFLDDGEYPIGMQDEPLA